MASAVDSAMVARVKDKFPVICSSVLMPSQKKNGSNNDAHQGTSSAGKLLFN